VATTRGLSRRGSTVSGKEGLGRQEVYIIYRTTFIYKFHAQVEEA